MIDVTAMGELLVDFTSLETDAYGYPVLAAHPGGAPANFLAALAKFGLKTALIAKVGDDAFGRLLTRTLEGAGIDRRGLKADPRVFTTLAFVTLDSDGGREFSFARKPGADAMLEPGEVELSLIEEARVFHFGSLSLTGEPVRSATRRAVRYAKEKGKLITFDPNYRRPLWDGSGEAKKQMLWGVSQADVVKVSEEENEFLFGCSPEEGAEYLIRKYGVRLAFVTLGREGCVFATERAAGRHGGFRPAGTVDTTGAGDIFGGAAVYKLLETGKAPEALTEAELYEIAEFANAAAALSTMRYGGISSIPALEAVSRLIAEGRAAGRVNIKNL